MKILADETTPCIRDAFSTIRARIALHPGQPKALLRAVTTVYDIMADDRAMRGLLALSEERRPKGFDDLRKNYPGRREFRASSLIPNSTPSAAKAKRDD